MKPLTLALLQHACAEDPALNQRHSEALIRQAAAAGAQVIVTQELFLSRYFCQGHHDEPFALAQTIPGPATDHLQKLAAELGVVLVASLFEKRAEGLYHNTAVVVDADGALLGKYRKHHIPEDPHFHEKFYFTPGDGGYQVFNTRFAKLGVLICWDQWYPEAARLTALKGADVLLYPTAIGWLSAEREQWGATQKNMWRTSQVAHGIHNGCFVAAINRVGAEENLTFWGGSFVSDPYGRVLAQAGEDREEVLVVDVDLDHVGAARREWPFLRDRRIDSYGGITRRFDDEV